MNRLNNKISYLKYGATKFSGYSKKLLDYIVENQLLNKDNYALFVNQFRNHTDTDHGWRGEFWGKYMRGAVLMYRATNDQRLYEVMKNSVIDLLSTQDKLGRITTYPLELEFTDWDLWTRKYVMLALLYFYEICCSNDLKDKIIKALVKHADYILKFIGDGPNKKKISETFHYDPVASLNSSSILEPFMLLYNLTHHKRYLDFATHIVKSGMSYKTNIIKEAIENKRFPYQFEVRKAYEMMSCFEGLLEYYRVTKVEKYLKAVINFVDMILKTDFTIIGSSGVETEFFDHSSITQVEPKDEVGQETCVTVTLMKLLKKVYLFTGDIKYIAPIERATYNALYGAINITNQTMKSAHGTVWYDDGTFEYAPHESFPFDSYSPLYMHKRGTGVGGFRLLQDGRSYGCCACNGANGLALPSLLAVTRDFNGIYINLFDNYETETDCNGETIKIKVCCNPYNSNKCVITIDKKKSTPFLNIRIPGWMENAVVHYGNTGFMYIPKESYVSFYYSRNFPIIITYDTPVHMHLINNKVAFTKGPIALARDRRLDNIKVPLNFENFDLSKDTTKFRNDKFTSNVSLKINNIHLVDYASAGQDYDDPKSLITVWQDIK